MYRVVGDAEYTERLKREYERILREKASEMKEEEEEEDVSESEDEVEIVPTQTYPTRMTDVSVVRQDGLTCGMCALQNLYGVHIVNREDMDMYAQQLEKESFGEKMYDATLGLYSIEVLKTALKANGKVVQHVDLDKLPAEYFTQVLKFNPSFQGYIVTLDMSPVKHYVAIRHRQGSFRLLDSLPDAESQSIANETLFRRRENGHIYCSMKESDQRKVISVLAVGNSPFVEYELLHRTWSKGISCKLYMASIRRTLQVNRRAVMDKVRLAEPEVLQWCNRWRESRVAPSDIVLDFLCSFVSTELQGERSIVVRWHEMDGTKEHQTVVLCKSVEGLLQHLKDIQWIKESCDFYMQQNDHVLNNEYDENIQWDTEGTFEEYGIDVDQPIDLTCNLDMPCQAKIGGFYTFQSKVEGTCIGQQHNAYSVRDSQGNVHVIYKHCIENITK